ncbi:MAG: GNAT family N-acetyltransferase [Micrococcales bacterium]|nr:GNAT family N-acetyltransferase [Micrococcales bacterium]
MSSAHTGHEIRVVDPTGAEAQRLLRDYLAEIIALAQDSPATPDQVSEHVLESDDGSLAPPSGRLLLASLDGQPVGSIGVRRLSDGVCEIKRMYAAPVTRGSGLASALLTAAEQTAREEFGARTIRLDTAAYLHAAITLYRRAGFREVERYNDNPHAELWFEKRL